MNDPDAWYDEGNAKIKEGNNEDAIIAYDKATDLDPSHISSWNNKGIALSRLKRYEEAISCYDKILEIDPNHGNAWLNKANALRSLAQSYLDKANTDRTEAAKLINKALGMFDSANSCYDKGDAIKKQADL